MKPSKSILDESFTYVPSNTTAVDATWRRFGWRPLTEDERRKRRVFFRGTAFGKPTRN
jgi:hypothetical protein